jgi:hypothetical protein
MTKCYKCKKEATKSKRFYYGIKCECCENGKHYEEVHHCENCKPRPKMCIRVWISPEELKTEENGQQTNSSRMVGM